MHAHHREGHEYYYSYIYLVHINQTTLRLVFPFEPSSWDLQSLGRVSS